MDPRLLEYYNRELAYLRELGQEFAAAYPKVASRLSMSGTEVSDPYVERLLEGFSFLTARIQLKMDAQFPRFTQHLLEVLHPEYLAPTPSMAIAKFEPNIAEGSLKEGFTVPRGTAAFSAISHGEQTACEFRTAHEVTLWPLEIASANCGGAPSDLPLSRYPVSATVRGSIRIRLRSAGGIKLAQLPIGTLSFYLAGDDQTASWLYELIFGHGLGLVATNGEGRQRISHFLSREAIKATSFSSEQALLPSSSRGFEGHRLLHEYFALPNRFYFFNIEGLLPAFSHAPGDELDLVILLDRPCDELEQTVSTPDFALFCTPVINLFPKRSDRIAMSGHSHEHHLVMDRTRPTDFEVHEVLGVTGHGEGTGSDQEFRAFYTSVAEDASNFGAYYTTRREPRVTSDSIRRNGPRTSYVGSELFLSLVDQSQAPYSSLLRHLSVETLCTNRDLPLLIQRGGANDLALKASVPVESIRFVCGPTRPTPALADSAAAWRLISHLNQNYLSLLETNAEQGAQALRELLSLYNLLSDGRLRKQIDSLQSVEITPVTRRMPQRGPIVFGRGVQISAKIDENAFAGSSPFVLGAVLDNFFARHVSLNSFSSTVLSSTQRGRIHCWQPRTGQRPTA